MREGGPLLEKHRQSQGRARGPGSGGGSPRLRVSPGAAGPVGRAGGGGGPCCCCCWWRGGCEEGPGPSGPLRSQIRGSASPWGAGCPCPWRLSVRPHWEVLTQPPSESWKCLEVWAGLWSGGKRGLGSRRGLTPSCLPLEALRRVPLQAVPPPGPCLRQALWRWGWGVPAAVRAFGPPPPPPAPLLPAPGGCGRGTVWAHGGLPHPPRKLTQNSKAQKAAHSSSPAWSHWGWMSKQRERRE